MTLVFQKLGGLCQSMLLRRLQRQRLQAPVFAGACVKLCCDHPDSLNSLERLAVFMG